MLVIALAAVVPQVTGQQSDQAFQQGLGAYQRGDGLQAMEFWEPCATGGRADCQYGLGVLFDDGASDWPRDSAKALQWLRLAARQGYVDAQIHLGFLYAVGRENVAQDIVESYVWFSMAAAAGSSEARMHRKRVEGLMTEEELERALRLLSERGIHYKLDAEVGAIPSAPPAPASTR
jgi:TPR repeat protein